MERMPRYGFEISDDRKNQFIQVSGLKTERALAKRFDKAILEYARQAQDEPASRLREILNRSYSVPGFRSIDKAPIESILRVLDPFDKLPPGLQDLMLIAWPEAEPELFFCALSFLSGNPGGRLDGFLKDERVGLEATDIEKISGDFVNENPHYRDSRETVRLVLAYIKCFSAEPENLFRLGPFWMRCLDDLSCMPPNAAEWDQFSVFAEEFEKLKKKAAEERRALALKREVQDLLDEIHQGFETVIRFLEVDWNFPWDLEVVPADRLEQIANELRSLKESLSSYETLREQTQQVGRTMQEERIRRSKILELETMEATILAFMQSLSVRFSPVEENSVAATAENEIETPGEKEEDCQEKGAELISQGSSLPTVEAPPQSVEKGPPEAETDAGAQSGADLTGLEKVSGERTGPEETAGQKGGDNGRSVPIKEQEDQQCGEERERSSGAGGTFTNQAIPVIERVEKDQVECFINDLLSVDDLAGAYWVSEMAAQSGLQTEIPSAILAAITGARMFSWDREGLYADLLSLSKEVGLPTSEAGKLLHLSAALKPSLISPGTGMATWLVKPDSLSQIHELVEFLKDFSRNKYPLKPQDLLGAEDEAQRKAAISSAVSDAKKFMSETRNKNLKYAIATRVWFYFIGPGGPLASILGIVAEDQREKVEEVRKAHEAWQEDGFIAARIEQAASRLLKIPREIVGSPKRHLIDFIRQANLRVGRWVDLVDREKELNRRGSWLQAQIHRLTDSAKQAFPEVLRALNDLSSPSQPGMLRASAFTLGRAVADLAKLMKIHLDPHQSQFFSGMCHGWLIGSGERLSDLLSERLLLMPELAISRHGTLQSLSFDVFFKTMQSAHAEKRTLANAIEGWIDKQDYRFVDKMILSIEDDSAADKLRRTYHKKLEGSRQTLKAQIDTATESAEQAVVDGVVSEEERSAMLGALSKGNPQEELDFTSRYEEIRREVHEKIDAKRKERLAHQGKLWEDMRLKVLAAYRENQPLGQAIVFFVDEAIKENDSRVVGECLAHLSDVLESGRDLDESLFKAKEKPGCETLKDFLAKEPDIQSLLQEQGLPEVLRCIGKKESFGPISYAPLPRDRWESARQGLNAFYELKKSRNDKDRALFCVRELLSFLGYRAHGGPAVKLEARTEGRDALYLRASVTAANLARPIPEFGSLIEGSANVLALWERPVAETIASRIQELRLDRHGLIVIYLGRLSQGQRWDLLRLCCSQNLTLAVLDEMLAVYLTKERGERLGTFLRCALPFTSVIPYKPFVQGDVPSEMFYGRKRMSDELLEYSTCLVYGGRQLGKSALLRNAQRRFHNPANEHYAIYIDIKNVGAARSFEAGRYQDEIWGQIRDALKEVKLLKANVSTTNPETLCRHIETIINERLGRRILLLLDEADNFLDADSQSKDFPVLQELKNLMSNTGRRFKVVIAGLQTVQRFSKIPNQPLAQFGVPLRVGPLDAIEAVQLVREPTEILGYEMDEKTALRILSYTNYHAGLVQLFCKKLIENMTKRRGSGRIILPARIEREHVEAVYRDQAVRDEIVQRFALTLQLDARYQAIAWTLIAEQSADQDSYARSFTPKEVRTMVKFWWPAGFRDTEVDDVTSKLDEMCALGVLARSADGRFRLRSPNVVALMGSGIEDRLEELSHREPEEKFKPDAHHTPLDEKCTAYSPLTYSQERDLSAQASGVGIVFCSPALGLANLPEAIKKLIPAAYIEEGIGVIADLSDSAADPDSLRKSMTNLLQSNPKAEQLIAFIRPVGSSEALEALVSESLDFCARHKSRTSRRWCRAIFVLEPEIAENWFRISEAKREELEARCDAVISPRLWTDAGIRNRLDQLDKLSSPEVCQAIKESTGGWHMLVDELIGHTGGESNLIGHAVQMAHKLAQRGSELGARFLRSTGLGALEGAQQVFNLFLTEESVPESLLLDLHELIEPARLCKEETQRTVSYLRRFRILYSTAEDIRMDPIIKNLWVKRDG